MTDLHEQILRRAAEDRPAPSTLPTRDDAAAMAAATADETVEAAQVLIGGRPPAAPTPCGHRRFNQQVEIADMVDRAGDRVAVRAQLKVRCAECGVPFRFLLHAPRRRRLPWRRRDVVLTSDDRRTLGALIEPCPE